MFTRILCMYNLHLYSSQYYTRIQLIISLTITIYLYTYMMRYRSPSLNRNLSKPVFNILTTLLGGHNYDLSEMYTYILHDLSLKQLLDTHLLFTYTLWYERFYIYVRIIQTCCILCQHYMIFTCMNSCAYILTLLSCMHYTCLYIYKSG